ncbi:hypothetical protein ACFRDV_10185 [Streptomyces fagopyri]|uniref:hypothetical protein n=1 Tax=Streptomyces fagopyri TaxID=2662397 RepID=UPI0036B26697
MSDHSPSAPPARSPSVPAALSAVGPAAADAPSVPEAAGPTPAAEDSRAGSDAGQGRARPGREERNDGAGENDEDSAPTYTDRDPVDESAGSATSRDGLDGTGDGATGPPNGAVPVEQHVVGPGTASTRPALRVLPLGGGLILIGLGLGMAFLALRLRRG